MDYQLRAVIGLYAECMLCVKHHGNLAVCRCNDFPFRRNDGRAFAKNLLAECRVIDLAHGHGFAAHRSCDDIFILFFSPKQFL